MTGQGHRRERVHSITPDVYNAPDLNLNWNDSEHQRPDGAIRPLLLFQLFLSVGILATLGMGGIWMLFHL